MNKIKNIKGILFDFGGTIDTNGIHWSEMIWMAYEENKIAVKKAEYEKAYIYAEKSLKTLGIHDKTTFYEILMLKIRLQFYYLEEEKNLDNNEIETTAKKIADSCYKKVKLNISEQKEVLSYLKTKYILGLVSNFYGNLKTVIAEFDLNEIFTEIIDSQIIGIRKPNPRIWESSMNLLHLMSKETIIIGDSYINDIAPAKFLNCQAIWLKGKSWNEQNQFEHFSADHIIYNLSDLKKIL